MRGSLSGRIERQLNRGSDSFRILHDLVCPKAQHSPALALHGHRSSRIGFDLKCMVLAVDFDHQFPRDAGETREVRTDWMLASEFDAIHSPIAQHLPADTLGAAAVATQFPCSSDIAAAHAPSPNLSPCGGEEHDI